MCYAKPGPRCSGHTREEYNSAVEQHGADSLQAMKALDGWLRTPEGIKKLRTEGHHDLAQQYEQERADAIKAHNVGVALAKPEVIERLNDLARGYRPRGYFPAAHLGDENFEYHEATVTRDEDGMPVLWLEYVEKHPWRWREDEQVFGDEGFDLAEQLERAARTDGFGTDQYFNDLSMELYDYHSVVNEEYGDEHLPRIDAADIDKATGIEGASAFVKQKVEVSSSHWSPEHLRAIYKDRFELMNVDYEYLDDRQLEIMLTLPFISDEKRAVAQDELDRRWSEYEEED